MNGEPRQKCSVVALKKIDFVRESRVLLDGIKAYGV